MDLLEPLIDLFTAHGHVAVFVVLLVCGFGVPIPEDITLVAGGIIAGLGYADVRIMCVVALVGVLLGDSVMFLGGRVFGERALKSRWVRHLLTPRRVAKVRSLYAHYGNRVMFVARFLPGLRAPVFLSAGMSRRVPFRRFLLLDGFAALISVPLWVHLGYYGAENRDWLAARLAHGKFGIALAFAGVVIAVALLLWRRGMQRHRRLHGHRARRRDRTPSAKARSPSSSP
jgi:membrane protein DedA with SNARE-associated domain